MELKQVARYVYGLTEWSTKEQQLDAFLKLRELAEPVSFDLEKDSSYDDDDDYMSFAGYKYTVIPHKGSVIIVSSGGVHDWGVYKINLYGLLHADSSMVFESDLNPVEFYNYIMYGDKS